MRKLLAASLALLAFAPASAVFARPITATDVATMRRIAAPAVSPDGNWVVYQLRETDLEGNRGRTDLWLLDLRRADAEPVRIASSPQYNEHDPRFSADGRWIYYLSNASGSDQLWRVAPAGGAPEKVTDLGTDIGGFLIAPTGDRIALWTDRDMACADFNCTNNAAAAAPAGGSARVYDETFVRHWDSWATQGTRSRIFTFPMLDGRPQGAGTPVSPNLAGDSPSKPFGGAEELAWSADGRTLYFTLREGGRTEPNSTNMDIYAAREGEAPVNLTAANRGMDTGPAVSPDDRWLAYTAMARPTYEADRQVVQLRNLQTGETRALTQAWDRSVNSIAWAPDGRSLLVTAGDTLDTPVFRVDVRSGRATRLTQAGTTGNVVPVRDGSILFTLNRLEAPDDLWRLNRAGEAAALTAVNADKLAGLDPVHVERFSFPGAHGDTVWGQIVRPEHAEGRLPTLLLIHGGPQSSFGNGWSYRWNPWVFAAPGYAAVTVDFHGSTGYGQAFTDAINRDWGGAPLEDLRLGLAAAGRTDTRLDLANSCALGGSYGGFMANWIAGNWPDGFKCLVSHSGVFDQRAMAYETEELWFSEWEFGGPYFDPRAAENYERNNPVNFVQNWRTPMLVIHGERDFRIPYSQSLGVFNALQRRNIPSRLVVFPDENHWILKP
ncbi:MAG TPA: S9 family peptidase, partial [Allosphingosinicella sp.]|nr:S9 family peptidase [Allosphingosinicella sp.]